MADIFLSYSREDIESVRPLVSALEKEGFTVWWDRELTPGDKFEETIDHEIQQAACIVVVWSEVSVESRWVKNEALEGLDREVLVPVLLDNVRLPVAFRQDQIADFTAWPDSVSTDEFSKLIQAINRIVHGTSKDVSDQSVLTTMRPRGRRRFRRKRDIVVPVLVTLVVALSLYLGFSQRPAPDSARSTITVDSFAVGQGDSARFYADSLTREVQQQLRQVDDLRLIQISSLWDLEILPDTAIDFGLEVDYVLRGQVDANEQDITLSVTLSDTDQVVWQESMSGPADEFLDLQHRLVLAVLSELEIAADDAEQGLKPATTDHIAYRNYLLGQDLLRRGETPDVRKAIERFNTAVGRDEDFTLAIAAICRANLELYRATFDVNDYEAGKDSCNQMLELDRRNVEAHLAFAELYKASGELVSAKREFQETLRLEPDNADAKIGLADVLETEGDMQQAQEMLETVVRMHPTYWRAHNALGSFHLRAGLYHQAMEGYLQATKLMGGNTTIFNNLGVARLYAGDFTGAYRAWEQANDLAASSAVLSNMGSALYYAKRYDYAAIQYQRAIKLDEEDHRLWGNLGDALGQIPERKQEMRSAYLEAIARAEPVIGINPDDAYTISRLAVYYAALERREEAEGSIRSAMELAALDPNVLYDIAIARKLLGEMDVATSLSQEALEAGYPRVLLMADPQLKETIE